MTPERFIALKNVLNRRQPDLTVLLDGVHKPHNINAIIRSCDAVGVHRIHHVPVASSAYRPLKHTAKGSQKYVHVTRHEDTEAAVKHLRAQGIRLLAADLSAHAKDYRAADFTRPTALVLGAELTGVSDCMRALTDDFVVIPMQGMVESLNVSVAAALLLFEAQRQRLAAGLYNRVNLSAEEYHRTLFEWCWPKVAGIHRRANRAYPPLDSEGNILRTPDASD